MAISFRVVASDGGYYGDKDDMFEAEQLKKFCEMHDPNCYIEKYEYESNYEKTIRLEFERDALQNLVDEYKQLEQDGLLVRLPCKVGDTINQFKWVTSVGMSIQSDVVTRVQQTKNGFTIYTKKIFYPIKTSEYDIAPISQYPNALADFYIGTREAAEKALEELKK